MEDFISVVLPVYNGEKYLRESIDSVLAQTYSNWEMLILDDCSSDSSPEIAKTYASKDSRIRYIRNEKNLGLPANLNKGFSLARGSYLTWTSDDNRYKPAAFEKMVLGLRENNAQFVFASCRIIDEAGTEIEYISVDENSAKEVIGRNSVGACFLYTREVYETIGDYDPGLELVEDYDYWQRVFAEFSVTTISEYLYDYRWHSGALTSTMRQEKFRENLEKMLLKNRLLFGKLTIRQNYLYYQALSSCRNGKRDPYVWRKRWYSFLHLFMIRVPRKVKRILDHNMA